MNFFNLKNRAGTIGAAVACAAMMGLSGMAQAATSTTTTVNASNYSPTQGNGNVTFDVLVDSNDFVFGPYVPTGTVYFYIDGQLMGSARTDDNHRVTQFSRTFYCAGVHTVNAVYAGDSNFSASQSATVTVNVQSGFSFGGGGDVCP